MSVSPYKFGEFELDRACFELRRQCRSRKFEHVSLERIPLELLFLLAEEQGSVVTRQQIVNRLWGKDVFVDTEHGINTAIHKIRQALRDDPDHPRFVLTVTGKGYRFVAGANGYAAEVAPPDAVPRTGASATTLVAADALVDPGGGHLSRLSETLQPALPQKNVGKTSRIVKTAIRLLTLVALIFLGVALRSRLFPSPAAQIHSIAVLPLANLSGDSAQDYFADGMTDELITALAKNRDLRIVSRTSAMRYKKISLSLPEIARELGVDGILEGSIERTADRVHMTVQLIYAPTDTHVWAESYDRDVNHAYSLPEDLSQMVAKEVKLATSSPAPPRYINPEAHDAYLHGRYFWFTHDIRKTLPYFERAIEVQPDYAAAWSGLADTYALAGMSGALKPLDAMEKSESAGRKALALDDSLPEAHNTMCTLDLFYSWDPARAVAECRRGIELNPNYAELHYVYHYVLLALNQTEESLAEEKRSAELDPFARYWGLGKCYISLRQFDAALNEFTLQVQARPSEPALRWYLSDVYWLKGMYKDAQQAYEKGYELQGRPEMAAAAHKVWLEGGEPAVERWKANNLKVESGKHHVNALAIADMVTHTGDKDETMRYLERAYGEHDPDMILLTHDPHYDFLHSDARYQALVKKLGLRPAN
jgi:TolB-like protein/DNA-binding winged helix-turn-helix (wHTH) protein